MDYKQTLNKVKALLSIEVQLEQMKLADGVTVLEAESFEPGYSVGIVTPDGIVPAPVGEHETMDGNIIVVEVEGQILEVKPKAEEEMEPETPAPNAEAAEIAAEPKMAEAKKIVETVSKETFFSEIEEDLKAWTEDLKSAKLELSEAKKEIENLKVELAEAGAKAISFNPEPATQRPMTALERFREIKKNLN
jgi:hypothetical protein